MAYLPFNSINIYMDVYFHDELHIYKTYLSKNVVI